MSRRLEIGAGNNKEGNFIHTDLIKVSNHHLEVICRGEELPFVNASFDYIFIWGTFEHFTFRGAQQLLSECNRVLVEDGSLELTTPDLEAVCKIIIEGKIPFKDNEIEWNSTITREKNILNYALGCLYGGQDREGMVHQWGWTKEMLKENLSDAGFDIVSNDKSSFQTGTHWHCIAKKREAL